jgi:hypothetical protein
MPLSQCRELFYGVSGVRIACEEHGNNMATEMTSIFIGFLTIYYRIFFHILMRTPECGTHYIGLPMSISCEPLRVFDVSSKNNINSI